MAEQTQQENQHSRQIIYFANLPNPGTTEGVLGLIIALLVPLVGPIMGISFGNRSRKASSAANMSSSLGEITTGAAVILLLLQIVAIAVWVYFAMHSAQPTTTTQSTYFHY